MRLSSRTWLIISVICFLGALYFWKLGDAHNASRKGKPQPDNLAAPSATNAAMTPRVLLSSVKPGPRLVYTATNAFPEPAKSRYPHRLRNSDKPLDELIRSDEAVLLANALLDVSQPLALHIPESLRSDGNTANYVVQSKGVITESFRRTIRSSGGIIVSYVPNNALLVRLPQGGVDRLAQSAGVQSVVPWEPYFKIQPAMMKQVLANEPLAEDAALSLVVFPGERDAALKRFQQLGYAIATESSTPFGTLFTVQGAGGKVVDLARMDEVQWIEPRLRAQLVNDLARVKLGVNSDSSATNESYLKLTGENVVVNVNDSGIDSAHPDLAGRVEGDAGAIVDTDGHGTHVAGTIASSGLNSPTFTTNAPPGSSTNANFRGKAPKAKLFALPIDLNTGPFLTDAYLQETAASTNALISNNSWGYIGAFDYSINSASYDAAVRDALPKVPGQQGITYVFAAANSGNGSDDGKGGFAGSISAPGNAKNVITVGALESLRNITNSIVTTNEFTGEAETNSLFLFETDSSEEVAGYSSRGNVSPGLEGEFGRFKPDVVAPGSWIISTRSSLYNEPADAVRYETLRRANETIPANTTNVYGLTLEGDVRQLTVRILPNVRSASPFPNMDVGVRAGSPPPPADASGNNYATLSVTAGDYYVSVANNNSQPVSYDILLVISVANEFIAPDYFTELKKLNDPLKPHYRYESGTSMATPAVTGLIALMQEFFRDRLGITNPSPALFKALLINGAKTGNRIYDRQVRSSINFQGWGIASLTNSIPAQLDSVRTVNDDSWPMRMYDQSPTNALATGESMTRVLEVLNDDGKEAGLNVTLVWTDPPGNPAVGMKLVNDLDLVVTNLTTGDVFFGNNIDQGSTVNSQNDTNAPPVVDVVNNVENVFLGPRLSDKYSITVRARRVNVNALTSDPDGIRQDFALVVSSGKSSLSNIFKMTEPAVRDVEQTHYYKELTNGVPVLQERVGANSPFLVSSIGSIEQWNFYKFVNVGNTNPYVAIITFQPPNLSKSRLVEADIDLYVSQDFSITNLSAAALGAADRGLGRGGTEYVAYTNSPADSVYYIAVKSEDQQASEFGLVAIATDKPFDENDGNGNSIVRLLPVPVQIPDGSPDNPSVVYANGIALMFGLSRGESIIRNVSVDTTVRYEELGDMTTLLSHPGQGGFPSLVTLAAHTTFNGPETKNIIYDDDEAAPQAGSVPSEGPTRLTSFIGQSGQGVWQMAVYDNARFNIGTLLDATIRVARQDTNITGDGVILTARGNSWAPTQVVEIPADATQVDFCVSGNNNPVELYVGYEFLPDRNFYTAFELIDTAPGECLTLSYYSSPPLAPGVYLVRIFNPNANDETFRLKVNITRGLVARGLNAAVSADTPMTLLDDARTVSTINVATNQRVIEARVGVRIDHPRVADLSLHLVTAQGTRLLLSENRGGPTAADMGFDLGTVVAAPGSPSLLTNYSWVTFTESSNEASGPIKFAVAPFKSSTLAPQPLVYEELFNASVTQTYIQGQTISGIWNVVTNSSAIVELNAAGTDKALALSGGVVSGDLPINADRQYELSFAFKKVSSSSQQRITTSVDSANTGWTIVDTLRICPGQTVSVLVDPTQTVVDSFGNATTPGGYGGQTALYPTLTGAGGALIGQWSYSPVNLRSNTMAGEPFLIGTNVTQVTAPSEAGDYYLWLRMNDDVNVNNSGAWDVTLNWQVCQYDTFQWVLGGVTNSIIATDDWQTNRVLFTGSDISQTLAFIPGWNFTTLIDSIRVVEPVSSVFYLPEESMLPIKGELAQGDWRLEITDSRTGPTGSTPQLLSWYLQLQFAPTQQAIPLTNSVAFTDVVKRGDTRYFVVDVPREATRARNFFVDTGLNGGVQLMYARDGLPVGNSPPDPLDPNFIGSPLEIDLGSPAGAELVPGGRYFLGIRNADRNTDSNVFSIQIEFEIPQIIDTYTLTFPTPDDLVVRTNSFLVSTNLLDVPSVLNPGSEMHWYKFLLPDSTNGPRSVVWTLQSTNAELHLVARRGLASVDYLPTPTLYDYHSIHSDLQTEYIIVRDDSIPVPLTATPWLVGIYNTGTNSSPYVLRAKRWDSIPPGPPPVFDGWAVNTNLVSITNEISFTLAPGGEQNWFYERLTDATNTAVMFEVYELSGDADAFVRRADFPSAFLYDFSDLQTSTNSEHVAIRTGTFVPTLGAPNNWYVNLINRESVAVTGKLRVVDATGTGILPSVETLTLSAAGITTPGNLTFSWNSLPGETYRIESRNDLADPWVCVEVFVADSSLASFTDTLPLPVTNQRYFRVIQSAPGTTCP